MALVQGKALVREPVRDEFDVVRTAAAKRRGSAQADAFWAGP